MNDARVGRISHIGQFVSQLLFVGSVYGANGVGLLNPNLGVKITDGGSPNWCWVVQHFRGQLIGKPLALLVDGLDFFGVGIGPTIRVAVQGLRAHRPPIHDHIGGNVVWVGGVVQYRPLLESLQYRIGR